MPIIYKSVNIWDWIGENFSKVWIEWDKGFHFDLSCTLCSSNLEMNQEHLEICEGTVHERRGLDMGTWRGLLDFWRRMIKKLEATVT